LRRAVSAKQEVTRDWVVAKLKAIVEAKITDIATWGEAVPTLVPNADGEGGAEPEFRKTQKVELIASDKLPEHIRGAIAEVSHTSRGIRIKMHSKLDALDKLIRMAGFYEDKSKVDIGLEAIIRKAETLTATRPAPGQPWDN
jgi:phage terminase small subunit